MSISTHPGTAIVRGLGLIGREFEYQFSKPKRVLFDHLPKCAGTSLNQYLLEHYPKRLIFRTTGIQPQESARAFQLLPQEKRFGYRLIIGHETHSLLEFVHPETIAVTILRNPIDRIVSHYYYVKQQTGHYLHEHVVKSNLPLEDYVMQKLSIELENWYTQHFAGLTVEEVEQSPDEALRRALKVITERYDIIGFQDDFPAAVGKLRASANLRRPFQNDLRNKTRERSSLTEISEVARKAISEKNSVDMKLFDLLKQRAGKKSDGRGASGLRAN